MGDPRANPRPMSTPPSPTALLSAFHESYPALVRFIARRTGSPQDARELAHDAWIRVAERATLEDGPPAALAARAYVYTVAENIAIDHLRRRQRGAERFAATPSDADPGAPDALSADVAEHCGHRQALHAVSTALEQLPSRSRAIFLADRLDGASHAELAERHGVSIKTVEREVMRAMDSVAVALHQWRGDAAPVRTGRRRALSALLGVAGMGVGSVSLWQAWRQWMPGYTAALAAAIARPQAFDLPDGSRLTLDAASRAEVAFYAGRRIVRLLAGCAFFDVAHDLDRPFTVFAAGHEVTVLGTRFEVELQDRDGLRVAVESGRVRVRSADGAERVLGAGDRARIDAAARLSVTHDDAAAVAPWRDGWLDFHHTSLGEAVARLARYSTRPMRVETNAADLPVIGRVHIANSVAWLRLLPGSLPVRVREEGAERTLVVSRRS